MNQREYMAVVLEIVASSITRDRVSGHLHTSGVAVFWFAVRGVGRVYFVRDQPTWKGYPAFFKMQTSVHKDGKSVLISAQHQSLTSAEDVGKAIRRDYESLVRKGAG